MSELSRSTYSWDWKPVTIEAAVLFQAPSGGNAAPTLLQWNPPQGSTPGFYSPAAPGGCGGVVGVQLNVDGNHAGAGDYTVILQDRFQRVKNVRMLPLNNGNLGTAAPFVTALFGNPTDGSGYPSMTSYVEQAVTNASPVGVPQEQVLTSGHTGTAAASVPPSISIGSSPGFTVNQFAGMTWVDDLGNQFPIVSNTSSVVTLSGTANPDESSSAAWSIIVITSPQGATTQTFITVTSSTVFIGTPTVTSYAAATFTVASSAWLVNEFSSMNLVDSTGTKFPIASNSATVLTLQTNAAQPTTGAFQIQCPFGTGQVRTVISGAAVTSVAANTFTPTVTTNWKVNEFGGMTLVDPALNLWQITSNSTTALKVASVGAATTPSAISVGGGTTWSIIANCGASSIEINTQAVSSSVSLAIGGAVTSGLTGVPNGAMTAKISAATASWTGASAAITSATFTGVAPAANSLVGGILSDGTASAIIISNTAFTGSSGAGAGTIVVQPFPMAEIATATIPTGTTVSVLAPGTENVTGTPVGLTVTGGSSLASSLSAATPANGEVLLFEIELSGTTVSQ